MKLPKEKMLEIAARKERCIKCEDLNCVNCDNFVCANKAWGEEIAFYEKAMELLQADADGRLLVLPCKVGDTIYYTKEGRTIVEPLKVRTFFVVEPARRGEILHLRMIRTDKFDVSMDAIGKTVFLTREEAEAALEKMGGGEK